MTSDDAATGTLGERLVLTVGDRVRFRSERQAYTVRAASADQRYAICTKPFNVRHTVLYSIIDFHRGVRGPDNLVFSSGYETPEQITENMQRLESGAMEVSHRREATLYIQSVNGSPVDYDHWSAPIWAERKRWQAKHDAWLAARSAAEAVSR